MTVIPAANRGPLHTNDATMRYRLLGKTGLKVSALSMGCMRLTEDQDRNTAVVAQAIEHGVNYFETTRFYCGGQCQQRTAPGLVGHQDSIIASGKSGINPNATAHSFHKEIEVQLDILGLTHFKFFQVGWFSWGMMPHLLKSGGVLQALREAQDSGLVHHIGFTGHDSPENFTKCIETGIFDTLTVPYNLLDRRYESTIARAGELGVGVVAMCPVAGGTLSCESDKLKTALNMDMPTTEMALRFVLANPNVSTACSGMWTTEQLEQNVATVQAFDPDRDADFATLCEGLERLRDGVSEGLCTACGYCMPCPQGINIPRYMELYRNWQCFGLEDNVRQGLEGLPEDARFDRCNDCGVCEEKCPNDLSVRDALRAVETIRV